MTAIQKKWQEEIRLYVGMFVIVGVPILAIVIKAIWDFSDAVYASLQSQSGFYLACYALHGLWFFAGKRKAAWFFCAAFWLCIAAIALGFEWRW